MFDEVKVLKETRYRPGEFGSQGVGRHGATDYLNLSVDTKILALIRKAAEALGEDAIPNLMAIGEDVCVVYYPEHISEDLKKTPSDIPIQFKSLSGLGIELIQLANLMKPRPKLDPLRDIRLKNRSDATRDGSGQLLVEWRTLFRLLSAVRDAVLFDRPLRIIGHAISIDEVRHDENRSDDAGSAKEVDPAYETFPAHVRIQDYNAFIDSLTKDR